MKMFATVLSLLIFAFGTVKAQDCSAYIIAEEGKTAEYVTKNKKGKVQSYYSNTFLSKTEIDEGRHYEIMQVSKDKDKNEIMRDTLVFECRNGSFYADMSRYIDEEQLEAYEETQISFEFENVAYPADMAPGETMDDGSITISIDAGMMTITNETKITNRKVEARESLTVPAGTFDCLKISEEVENKIGFVTVKQKTVAWISEGIGTIKSETYNKKDRLTGTTELIKFE